MKKLLLVLSLSAFGLTMAPVAIASSDVIISSEISFKSENPAEKEKAGVEGKKKKRAKKDFSNKKMRLKKQKSSIQKINLNYHDALLVA